MSSNDSTPLPSATSSCVKQRKKSKLAFLRLGNLQKELEEIQNEPLDLTSEDFIDNDESKLQEMPDLDTSFRIENNPSPKAKTPLKAIENATPHTSKYRLSVIPEEIDHPKIKYTIDVNSYLRTPFNEPRKPVGLKCTPLSIKQCIVQKPTPTQKENVGNHQFAVPRSKLSNSERVIIVNDVSYFVWNQIGKGGSSVVYHCFQPQTKSHAAIKCVSLQSGPCGQSYINEVKLLERLQKCSNIIRMFDYELLPQKQILLVVLELGSGDLHSVLKQSASTNKCLPFYKIMFYWMEMLHAVNQIHQNDIVHADLKPANFIFVRGDLKLIDFGIARQIQHDMTSVMKTMPEGSFNYVSPEALRNDSSPCSQNSADPKYKISFKSDVWSLGCILYQLVYKRTPFEHIGHMYAKLSAILDPCHKINYPETTVVPQRIINTIKRCLQYEYKSRPSVQELIDEYENASIL